jgi:LPS-assembly lipoprotein
MPVIKTATCIALLVLLTSSCGWHLRGTQSFDHTESTPDAAFSFSLVADDIYTPMYRVYKSDYENRRVNLTNTENRPQLKLLAEATKNRILSLNTELDTAESELAYTIRYQITLSPKQTPQLYSIQLFRTYTQNKNRAIARDNEKIKLIDEMRHEAAERIFNQIGTLTAQQKSSP